MGGGRGGQGQLSSSEAGFPDPGNFAAPDCDYQKRDIGSIKLGYESRLAKRREILVFPRTAGNTGNSRELLVIPGNYWEIGPSLMRKF